VEEFDIEWKQLLVILFIPTLWIGPCSVLFSYCFESWLGKNIATALGAILAGLISYPLARKTRIDPALWVVVILVVGATIVFHDWLPSFPTSDVCCDF
jgi:uncharacterized membrane protein YjjB (DUF3815 family)